MLTVQDLLNDHVQVPMRLIAEDGIAGPETIGAILDFQRRVMAMLRPDGRVDPGHATIRALNRVAETTPPPPAGIPPTHITAYKADVRKVFREEGQESLWLEFWDLVVKDITPEVKRFFSMIGKLEEARQVARFYVVLRRDLGASPREMKQIFQAIMGLGKPRWSTDFVKFLAEPTTKMGGFLKGVKAAGGKASYVLFLIQYMDYWSKGDYHMAIPMLYKEFMGSRIPWAKYIDGAQSFLALCLPKSWQQERSYKAMKAVNPLDLGAQGVDAACVVAHVLVVLFVEGKLDEKRIGRLAERMKKGSTALFYDLGDDLANALAAIADMSDEEFDEMMTAGNIFAWLNDFWLTKYTPSLVIYRLVRDQFAK